MKLFRDRIGQQGSSSCAKRDQSDSSGFTLLELLVVIIIIGVLAAIAAPGWLGFMNQRRVNASKDAVLQAVQEAKNKAQKEKVAYSVSFRSNNGIPQIAVHPTSLLYDDGGTRLPNPVDLGSYWTAGDLGNTVGVKKDKVLLLTNLSKGKSNQIITSPPMRAISGTTPVGDVSSITFDSTGVLKDAENSGLGSTNAPLTSTFSIVVAQPQGSGSTDPIARSKRCVMVRTLLGGLVPGREEYDQANNPDGCP